MGRKRAPKTKDDQTTATAKLPVETTTESSTILDEKKRYEARRPRNKQKDGETADFMEDVEKQGSKRDYNASDDLAAGAYRVGLDTEERMDDLSKVEQDSFFVTSGDAGGGHPRPEPDFSYESTVQAELVKDPTAAVLAEVVPDNGDALGEISELRNEVNRNSKQNRRLMFALIFIAVLAVAIGVTVAVVMLTRSNGTDAPTPASPVPVSTPQLTMSPTVPLAPTTFLNLIESASPSSTIGDPTTPAGKAFNWLENDTHSNQVLQDLNFVSVIQRFALAVLFYATNGETGWPSNRRGWLNDAHECVSWNVQELKCDANFEIADVALGSADGVGGSLPSEISLLTGLTSLDLSRNDINGTIPSAMGAALTKLHNLRLFENDFVGSLPNDIGLLTDMRHFAVTLNALTGTIPASIGGMSKMTFLDIRDNLFTGTLPTGLEGLESLAFLYMFNLDVSGTLPVSLCDTFQNAWIDCGEVTCDCCTARDKVECP